MRNEMRLEFDSISANEAFARGTVAAFMTQMNPSMEEVADVKTAVSEAVTNAIIHGYLGEVHKIVITGEIEDDWLRITVEDKGTGIADIEKAMDSCTEVESLQKVISQGDGEGVSLIERVEQGKDEQEALLRRILLEELLSSLDPKERRLIVLRFFHDRTQTQVASELGMSQVQVSRLEKKILSALKEKM